MTTWNRQLYEHNKLAIAKDEFAICQPLFKFGVSSDIGSTESTIWDRSGDYYWPESTFTAYVLSSSGRDSSSGIGTQAVTVQGLDENFLYKSETVRTNGTTPVQLSGSWSRINRSFSVSAGSGGTTAGTISVTNVDQSITYVSFGNYNQTQVAAYTVPANARIFIENLKFSAVLKGNNKSATCVLRSKDYGSNVFRVRYVGVVTNSTMQSVFDYPIPFYGKTDLECRAYTDANSAVITANFQGVFFKDDT